MPRLKKLILLPLLLVMLSGYGQLYFAREELPVQYELTALEFNGNNSIASSRLVDVILSKRTPGWFLKFLNKVSESIGREASIFDSTKIPADLAALENFYKDNGFFKAKFSYTVKLNADNNKAELTYIITEGSRFVIRNYHYQGLDSLPAELTEKKPEIKADSTTFFTRVLIEQNNRPLVNFMRDNGYMSGDINRSEVFVYPDSNFVDIKIDVSPGRRFTIDSITVEKKGDGQEFVEDTLIKKIAGIKPGDYYSADERQRAQVRLYRTNLFSTVLVNVVSVVRDTVNTHARLNITGDISSLSELSPEFIVNNQSNAFNVGLGVNYSKKNFFGEARTFTLSSNFAIQDIFISYKNIPTFLASDDTSLGYLDSRAVIEQPYLLGRRITSRMESYFTVDKRKEYKTSTFGGKISFDFELPKFVYLTSLLTYYSAEKTVYDFQSRYIIDKIKNKLIAQGVNQDSVSFYYDNQELSSKREVTSIIGADLGINKTDNPIFPTRGFNITLTIEEANLLPAILNNLGGDIDYRSQFYRVQSTITYFPDIYNSPGSAFGVKLKAGYLQAYARTDMGLPLNKRFTAGGSNSVRGWRSRELAPSALISLSSNSDIADYVIKDFPFGGTFLIEGTFETRNRIYDSFGMAAFIDYGNTWEGYKTFSFSGLAIASGFGFRYYSPFAPLRLDFGFKAYDPVLKQNFFKRYERTHILQDIFNVMNIHLGIGEVF
ncbi:MAG: BamA/TamA family outer membrane protein [Ignavibacteria bacterium]